MIENGLHRLIMLAGGVIVCGFMLLYLFGTVTDDKSDAGFVKTTSDEVWEQSEARTHKY